MSQELDKTIEDMIEQLTLALDSRSTYYLLHCVNEEILVERARDLLVQLQKERENW